MTTFNVTSGKLEGTQIQARDEAHATKLLQARLRRLREKESKLTAVEISFILDALELMTGDFAPEMIEKENGEFMKAEEAYEIHEAIIKKLVG